MSERGGDAAGARDFDVVLVLSGGNALGAYEAGVYEALHAAGLHPDWVIGASIGAINGALIVGSPPERRVETLRAFWRPGAFPVEALTLPWLSPAMETGRRTGAVGWTAMAGRSGIFGPLLSSLAPWTDDRPAIFETNQLADTLARMVDFDRLNAGPCRYTATAVDVQTGDDVVFDSRDRRIEPDHVRASAALPIAFPPVAVDGRWLVDGGLSANLPLDPVLADPPPRATLCIAVDLLPLCGPVPATLGEAASRMQDLLFAAQSRRTIARWQAAHAGRDDVRLSLLRLAYTEQGAEVAGKALDFSGPTIERRWQAGHQAGMRAAARVAAGELGIGAVGLNVVECRDD
ncbi:patatin-like phospholipase family protein [Sphingomonas montana]|uniref:patatin-like phospholipase family protein n=1 Tax=Sphingomonas montana TaxID=1843236 RepID=UPI00096E2D1F|nr:patatin-like phospholipase family protein [Sphingomonas montana]